MKIKLLCLLCGLSLLIACSKKTATSPKKDTETASGNYLPGQSYVLKVSSTDGKSSATAIEYIAGDKSSQLIISAPHGGGTSPSFMRSRTSSYSYGYLSPDPYNNDTGFSSTQDSKTKEMAVAIADSIKKITGIRPHLVINHLHRLKLDANRKVEVAAQGDKEAEKAWNAYMAYLEEAKNTVISNNGSGLLIDVHGNGHDPQRTELGYLLSKSDFTNYVNNLDALADQSSIRALAKNGNTFASLIKGDFALGTLLNTALNVKVTPSKAYPEPGNTSVFTDGQYFNGGYITARFGSKKAGQLSSIQLEFNSSVRTNDSTRPKYAGQVARSLKTFMEKYLP